MAFVEGLPISYINNGEGRFLPSSVVCLGKQLQTSFWIASGMEKEGKKLRHIFLESERAMLTELSLTGRLSQHKAVCLISLEKLKED